MNEDLDLAACDASKRCTFWGDLWLFKFYFYLFRNLQLLWLEERRRDVAVEKEEEIEEETNDGDDVENHPCNLRMSTNILVTTSSDVCKREKGGKGSKRRQSIYILKTNASYCAKSSVSNFTKYCYPCSFKFINMKYTMSYWFKAMKHDLSIKNPAIKAIQWKISNSRWHLQMTLNGNASGNKETTAKNRNNNNKFLIFLLLSCLAFALFFFLHVPIILTKHLEHCFLLVWFSWDQTVNHYYITSWNSQTSSCSTLSRQRRRRRGRRRQRWWCWLPSLCMIRVNKIYTQRNLLMIKFQRHSSCFCWRSWLALGLPLIF